ncbi:MAG: hypothetical protein RR191_04875 [Cetobacterium sp.]|uniref:FMN-binding protein n=1 Tax=unclassified Cetobacterium TaxID=2630983 RepID=UPI00163C94B6|nr:hypothetical protein [Cetobacterium sp. 2A]MBC2856870.1 hypothetical protein [Cetobacterium sp. 2A]
MRKLNVSLGIILLGSLAFANLNDGEYRAEQDKYDKRGWKVFLDLKVENQKITGAKFDYVNKEGAYKSQDKAYNEKYKEICNVDVPELASHIEKSFIKTQNPEDIDALAGATESIVQFKVLAKAAMKASENKDKSIVLVNVK